MLTKTHLLNHSLKIMFTISEVFCYNQKKYL